MSETPTRRRARLLRVVFTGLTVGGLVTACSVDEPTAEGELGGTVSVLGTWSGDEQDSFLAMVEPWEEKNGVTVEYTGSRDLPAQITSGIVSGNLPDIAGLPGPGAMHDWYDQGALQPLGFLDFGSYEASTPPGFAQLGVIDGEPVGVFTKAAVKGLVYYNTANWTAGDPETWDDLTAAAAGSSGSAWCVGLESGAASGWSGTDWIEDILLRQSGPDAYDRLVSGDLAWDSDEVRDAFTTFGAVLDSSHGGNDYVVNTNFGRAANPMFEKPAGCQLHHQASFITSFFENEAGATADQFDFFPFPDIDPEYAGSVTGAGDLVGMFNDTPEARSLMEYLMTPEAQQIWVERGGFISANSGVPLDAYPDEGSRRAAALLQDANVFRFDASDQMPAAVSDAFNKAMVEFATDQSALTEILQQMDAVVEDSAQN